MMPFVLGMRALSLQRKSALLSILLQKSFRGGD
jgi:hypothetical protein